MRKKGKIATTRHVLIREQTIVTANKCVFFLCCIRIRRVEE